MSPERHEITCPCCDATISVDAETGAVLSHVAPKKDRLTFEEAKQEVDEEKGRVESKFEKALRERAKQSEILEKKFREAAEKAADDPERPPTPWDFD